MSNTAEKTDTHKTLRNALVAIKGYKPKDEHKFYQGNYKRSSNFNFSSQRYLFYRFSILFGFSLLICFVCFVSFFLIIGKTKKISEQNFTAQVKTITISKEPVVEYVTVLVPNKDIKPGKPLQESDFILEVRPKVSTPATALTSFAQISQAQSRVNLISGQPVLDSMIKNAKSINPVVASIVPGMRAVTIQVNANSSVEGWATAGAFVDIHWVTDAFGVKSVNLLAQNVKILSAERQIENDNYKGIGYDVPTTITLLVSEKDARKISLAATNGEIKMHLRGTEDTHKPALAFSLTLNELLGRNQEVQKTSVTLFDKKGNPLEFFLIDGKITSKKELG